MNYSNKIYSGTTKQVAGANEQLYITAVVGKGAGSPATLAFGLLTDLTLTDNLVHTFEWPIVTKDFTPSTADLQVIYYEGQ